MLADFLVMSVTWYNLWHGRTRGMLGSTGLSDILLRNGKPIHCALYTLLNHVIVGTVYFVYAWLFCVLFMSCDEL